MLELRSILQERKFDNGGSIEMDLSSEALIPLVEDDDDRPRQDVSNDIAPRRSQNYDESHGGKERIFSSRQLKASKRFSVTLNQLRFSELQMHGRTIEQETLMACLKKVSSNSSRGEKHDAKSVKQLVMISGASGTGKTALSTTLRKPVQRMGGFFSMGKYDLQHKSEPYLGLALACDQIFMQMNPLVSSESTTHAIKLKSFRKDLLEDLGDGIEILAQMVPAVVKYILQSAVTEYSSESDSEEFQYNKGRQEAKAKMQFVFRKLFRALCKHFGPMVVVLDDLQWADAASLELIEELVSDRKIHNLIVVGLYRSEEFHGDSSLAKSLHTLNEKTTKGMLEMTEITIGNMNVDDINGMITDLLSVDSSSATMELATLCHRRTRGNAFFVLSFLRMLDDKGFMVYNFGAMKWIWDTSKIASETNATTNVVALTQGKMASLSKEHQTLLAMASCLGHSFEKKKLIIVTEGQRTGESSTGHTDLVNDFLALALKEGYLEGPSGDELMKYRWVHDSIQEAALSLIPESELLKFKYDVGKSLLNELRGKDLDKHLFVVVGLLNPQAMEVGGLKDSEKEILATLNLAAAKRSMKLSAFGSTSKFAKIGISMLPSAYWETHTRLSYKLFTIACEAEAYQMNEEAMHRYGSEVLQQEAVSLLDKIRIYRAQLSFFGMGERNRINDAVELCLDVLDKLGCTFPKTEFKKTVKLILSLMKHKRELPKRTAEEVANLPVMTSRRLKEIDSILNELGIYAYTVGRTTLSGLCTMKQTSITLKHGVHDDAYKGFCSLAPFFMVAFGDLKATDQVARYSRYLKERMHGENNVAGFCMMQGSFSLPWTHHWSTTIKVLTDGFESGVREGELRNANYCISACLIASFFCGTSLEKLQQDIQVTFQYIIDLNIGVPVKDIAILQRCVEILLDDATTDGNTTSLVSEYEDSVKNEDFTLALLYVFQGYIYYARGDHQKCSSLSRKAGMLQDKLLSYFANMPVVYHQSLSFYVCAQKTSSIIKRAKLKGWALKRHNILRGWAKGGCCNVVHYVAILDAELAILNREKQATVEGLYQKAIVLAVRGGFVQDVAVANERLADFFRDRGEMVEAGRRYEQSIEYFEEWGYKKKAHRLGEESSDMISSWSLERRKS